MNSRFEILLKKVRDGLDVKADSRMIKPGEVFVAVPGTAVDGAKFIPAALDNGAAHIVAAPGVGLPEGTTAELYQYDDPRLALGALAAARYGNESADVPVIGITGTNGKTTVSYLVEHLLASAGRNVGVMGTVTYRWPGHEEEASHTTPDNLAMHAMLARMREAGVDAVVMEVSSHALDQRRAAGVEFAAGVLTNVTQDHLDYHGDMEGYYRAKARLFADCKPGGEAGVVNWDDPYGRRLAGECAHTMTFGFRDDCPGLRGEILESTVSGLRLRMTWKGESWEIVSPLVGEHNGSNLLAAQGVGLALGLTPKEFTALESFRGVPGRLERVPNERGLDVFVDYAHTPDALENVLSALHGLVKGRLFCVFGCGGDRDRTKRPLMGEAACRNADVAVVTSDNPRTEDPQAIIDDVLPGMKGCGTMKALVDRKDAIAWALGEMAGDDILVIAGKGHETYQVIGTEKTDFSDFAVVREILA